MALTGRLSQRPAMVKNATGNVLQVRLHDGAGSRCLLMFPFDAALRCVSAPDHLTPVLLWWADDDDDDDDEHGEGVFFALGRGYA